MTSEPRDPRPLPLRETAVFVALAYGLGWLVYLPALIIGAPPDSPLYSVSAILLMFTPTLAALLCLLCFVRPRGGVLRDLAITPLRPWGRLSRYLLAGLLVMPVLGLVAVLASAAMGVVVLDLEGFSGLRDRAGAGPGTGVPVGLILTFVLTTVAGMVTAIPIFVGEELGWRGYLLPRLVPLGVWPALVLCGVIQGLWHGPQLLIRLTAGIDDLAQTGVFLGTCVVFGVVAGWLRLASGSVWPAVLGHAGFTTVFLGFFVLADADTPTGGLLYNGGTTGLIGLAVTAALVVVLAVTGRMRGLRAYREDVAGSEAPGGPAGAGDPEQKEHRSGAGPSDR